MITPSRRFLDVLQGRPADTTPVWIMRQAGRYLPEYRAIREKHTFLEMCKTPELAARVTLQPLERFPLDAAILFSDILIPLEAMGLELTFTEGEGPRLSPPLRSAAAIAKLEPERVAEQTGFVPAAVRVIQRELAGRVPLIGFSGAPFTLACYAVEGSGSREFRHIKELMFSQPPLFHRLMDAITEGNRLYLKAQAEAGADVLQLFDTWGGILSRTDYEYFVWPYVRRQIEGLRSTGKPVIYFVLDGCHLLELVANCGAQALGLDWRTSLALAREMAGPRMVLQGNLDTGKLFAPRSWLQQEIRRILAEAGGPHVFNLGHGVWKDIPPDNVGGLVELVHELGRRN